MCSLVATAVADYEVAEGLSEVPVKGDSSGWHQVRYAVTKKFHGRANELNPN